MTRKTPVLQPLLTAGTILAGALALLVATSEPAFTDDTDLVRKNSAKPYLMLVLDTSGSMNLELGNNNWLPLNGDHPESKIYQAKKALYEVFEDEDRLNYGFMTSDHDGLRIRAKHWLYAPTADAQTVTPDWPLSYPLADTNSTLDPTDDNFTLGKHHPVDTDLDILMEGVGATCANPLDLTDDVGRAKASRFPKLDVDGAAITRLWVKEGNGGTPHFLEVSAPNIQAATPTEALGDPSLTLHLRITAFPACLFLVDFISYEADIVFNLIDEFLMADQGDIFADTRFEPGGNDVEDFAGFWDWTDAFAGTACTDQAPFSGKGLESNYDDPDFVPPPGFANPGELTGADQFCSGDPAQCQNLKHPTSVDSVWPGIRELDRGDFIPYHWNIPAKDEVLSRLNPNHGTGNPPEYRAAPFFADTPPAIEPGVGLGLLNPAQKPLIAIGETPFGKLVNDYRCWYLGPENGPVGKCREAGDVIPFEEGWVEVAPGKDPDFECRRPYAIIITDGEDTCRGEDPTADVVDFDAFGIRTWFINLGGKRGEKRLNSMLQTAKAEIITIGADDPDALKNELKRILGIIVSEPVAFAAAAVPSAQSEDEDRIYFSNFTPFNDSGIWAGEAQAFIKPLPSILVTLPDGTEARVPDTSDTTCQPIALANEDDGCFLWDAGEVLKTQIDILDPVGPSTTQRRVYYPQDPSGSGLPLTRMELDYSTNTGFGTPEEKDLWLGLGVPFIEGDEPSQEDARDETNAILQSTYSLKTAETVIGDPSSEIDFILGDNFHADPVILGAPNNIPYFVENLNDYRDYAQRQQFRRKMLVFGANDAMIHFFDAGVAKKVSNTEVRFGVGSGAELFAYVPRAILPKVKSLVGSLNHQWSIDGAPTLGDVYIDPAHAGTPTDDEREWRTVLVSGLRRGGEIVYALDVTHPDSLKEETLTGPPVQTVIVPVTAPNPTTPPTLTPVSLPDCRDSASTLTGSDRSDLKDCNLKFPAPLWEFDDAVVIDGATIRLDEDDNGAADLAQTWSKPNITRIQIEDLAGNVVDRFVAVFGGGLDPERPNQRGDWLYMVDVETGREIYKKQLINPYDANLSGGSAPAEPALIDINQDGITDKIYIPTTGGFVYRVDLEPDADGDPPLLESFNITITVGGEPEQVAVERINAADREPRAVFDNINTLTGNRLPFFFQPTAIFTPLLAPHFGIALGDGDRENLWSQTPGPSADVSGSGRFYVFVDDTDQFGGPITAAVLEQIAEGSGEAIGQDFLFNPQAGNRHGWYMTLEPEERVISEAFALSGITVFSTFTPETESTADPDNPALRLCSRRGTSEVFAVLTTNANGVLFDESDNRTRSKEIQTLVSRVFANPAGTRTEPGDAPPPGGEPPPGLSDNLLKVMDELKQLFPANCRFANYFTMLTAQVADTSVEEIAPIPICIIEKNWREF
jgi:hypothetical protein